MTLYLGGERVNVSSQLVNKGLYLPYKISDFPDPSTVLEILYVLK